MDLGIGRAIDHLIYTLLNTLALVLWRIDAAILNMAMLAYQTEDWLTGPGGGVWSLLAKLVGAGGLLGLNTWQLFFSLALILFGLSRVLRLFWPMQPVNLGRLFFFAVLGYVFITEGAALMQETELWRNDAASWVYQSMAGEGPITLDDVPGASSSSQDPIFGPTDLDGAGAIRGWEAVATSYFLVSSANELHAGIPPEQFRKAYCLYDPNIPIGDQTLTNDAGCNPRLAWDEWDSGTVNIVEDWLGIELPALLDIDLTPVPITKNYPENRQKGLNWAQAGVARLALGLVVALFPLIEANVSLMLALAASFIYLSLPIVLLFGFFLYTESMATGLFMQFISVFIRTVILHGLLALFLMLLIGAASSGSLGIYLGLVGVGLGGGFFLTRIAAGVMKESLNRSLGAVGGIWMGATTGLLGEGARRPARAALGAAKLAATGAAMGATLKNGGVMNAPDMAEAGYTAARSGARDLGYDPARRRPGRLLGQRRPGRLPLPLARIVQTNRAGDRARRPGPPPPAEAKPAVPLPGAALAAGANGAEAKQSAGPTRQRSRAVEGWADQVYRSQQKKQGRQQTAETGRQLLGQDLARTAQGAMSRHSQAETTAVLRAARETAAGQPASAFIGPDGRLKTGRLGQVRARLDEKTARAFRGRQGERDLAALVAAGLQPQQRARPERFRQALARARPGRGERAPGQTVPRALGLDPAAAGAHFASLNRFTRLSEQAGLSPAQRQRLLSEAGQGQVSNGLRQEIERSLKKQDSPDGLKAETLIRSAQGLPETLEGPLRIRLPEKEAPPKKNKEAAG